MDSDADAGTFSELAAGEAAWLQDLLVALKALSVDVTPDGLSRFFDEEWLLWHGLPADQRPDPNPVINRVGAGLGVVLGTRLDFWWEVFTDRQGADLALRGEPGAFTLFPMSSVAKRWVEGKLGWIPPYIDSAVTTVREARSSTT